MSIGFNPKIKADSISAPLDVLEEAFRIQDETGIPAETMADPYAPQNAVNAMDLLFSGVQAAKAHREAHPHESLSIPDLEKDILGPMPKIGSKSHLMETVIDRYTLVRRNLIDRRNNYAHALEGYLKPEEALDLHERIEEIHRALLEIDKNMERARHQKQSLEKLEEAKFREELARRDKEELGRRDGE